MNTIELIGIIVGSIATILGGVWFIVNKAFNFGKTSHRIDLIDQRTSKANCEAHDESINKLKECNLPKRVEVLENKTANAKCEAHDESINKLKECNLPKRVEVLENKTANAKCEAHDESIDKLKENIGKIFEVLASIKSILVYEHKEASEILNVKNSPSQLNEFGNLILKEINGLEFIDNNKDFLISKIDDDNHRTALDVENAAFMACVACSSREEFDYIKIFIYNSPTYDIKNKEGQDKKHDLSLGDVCFALSIPLRDLYLSLHPEIPTE